jgi:hypothetical protein
MMMSVVGRILGSSVERSSSGVVGVASWKIRPQPITQRRHCSCRCEENDVRQGEIVSYWVKGKKVITLFP